MRAGISVPSEDISVSLTTLGGRFLYTVQKKPRVRLYLGGGVNYTILGTEVEDSDFDEADTANGTGIGFEGVGGVEYSFSDLPNLGFAFEFGLGFLKLSAEDETNLDLHFTTSGTVGIHYYF